MVERAITTGDAAAYCTFRADERLFGIDVACLREISTNTVITPVPPAPPAVRGLANLRSRVHLGLDLRPLLGLPAAPCTPDSRLIILKPTVAEDTGLLVDRGGDILSVRGNQIDTLDKTGSSPDAPTGDERLSLVVGVCKLESELMMIIDATRLGAAIAGLLR